MDGEKSSLFTEQIRTQAFHFVEQLADPLSSQSGRSQPSMLVKMDAYGRIRYALVEKKSAENISPIRLSGDYIFIRWVTPDMEATAAKKNPPQIDPKEVEGHLPAPEKETNPERVVRMDAWGRLRLAVVSVEDEGIIFKARGVMTFRFWVDDTDKREVQKWEARGATQIGGINLVSPSDVKSLKAPTN